MNLSPHSHNPSVTRTYPHSWKGGWFVQYGDTRVRFAWSWQRPETWSKDALDKAISRATRKAVFKHDKGTQKEMRKYNRGLELRQYVIDQPILSPRQWGSEQLKAKS